jgi:hypothetical protein
MKPTNEIEIDGEIYDLYTTSLSLMVRHFPNGETKTSVNVTLVPTRIDLETGKAVLRNDHTRSLVSGNAENGSELVASTVSGMLELGQSFINEREL